MTFRYYFASLQHPWYHIFTFHLLFPFYLTLIIDIFHCLSCKVINFLDSDEDKMGGITEGRGSIVKCGETPFEGEGLVKNQ